MALDPPTIQFTTPEGTLLASDGKGRSLAHVGETVHCRFQWRPGTALEAERLTLRIVVVADGAGTTDERTVAESTLHRGRIPAGEPIEGTLPFDIPDEGPMHYEGKYVRFSWRARADLQVSWRPDTTWERILRVLPAGAPIPQEEETGEPPASRVETEVAAPPADSSRPSEPGPEPPSDRKSADIDGE